MLKEFFSNNSVKNQMLKKVYLLIQQNRQMTKNELLLKTAIKQTTLTRMLDELIQKNYIKESGHGTSSGGRPPILYQIENKKSYLIGIEISRMETTVVLLDLFFNLIEKETFKMTIEDEPQFVFQKIKNIIECFLTGSAITLDQILGIGVGTVGPLNREKGIIYKPEAFLAPNWENVKVKELLQQSFPVRIIVDNGSNAAAIAEYTQRQFSCENILYCISGYGVRCGVISNGQLIHSRQGDASASGHIIIQADGKKCICGQSGCLAAYASYGAILDEVKDRYPLQRQGVEGGDKSYSMDTFISELQEGNRLMNEISERAAYYYGLGIANMVNILHPELVVLHGSLIYQSSAYYEAVIESAYQHIYTPYKDTIKFSKGILGADGIAIGAGIQVFQTYFEESEVSFPLNYSYL